MRTLAPLDLEHAVEEARPVAGTITRAAALAGDVPCAACGRPAWERHGTEGSHRWLCHECAASSELERKRTLVSRWRFEAKGETR